MHEHVYSFFSDYVQCKVCLHQSSNPSSFDDINLAIRAFDEQQTPFHSLEAALTAFLEPETLEGDNAYYCEACACKCGSLNNYRSHANSKRHRKAVERQRGMEILEAMKAAKRQKVEADANS